MRMFVTGGGGFIGSHLVDLLIAEGHDVTVLLQPGRSGPRDDSADICTADIRRHEEVEAVMQQADVVYHLAARTDLDGESLQDYETNILGTRNVVAAAKVRGVGRFVFFSSMLAAATTGLPEPILEDAEAENDTFYGRSKREGERIVQQAGLEYTIIRPTMVFGPRDCSTMYHFMRAIRKRQFFLIGPDVRQSFVYVKNLTRATYDASLCPQAAGQIFFVNDERPYTIAEIARHVARSLGTKLWPIRLPRWLAMMVAYPMAGISKCTGVKLPLYPSRVRTMTKNFIYSIEKAQKTFGYRPQYNLKQSIEESVRWYKDCGML
ncbi:MAG: NAD-dependent epimerase/dehydratase family protein [Planctomycetota bacterium]|nr:NAD-dependent epimerase/dehydratase family protein [Planctomycetota bacterium]